MVLVFCFPTFLNGKIEFVLSFFRPNSSELSEAGTRAEKAEVAMGASVLKLLAEFKRCEEELRSMSRDQTTDIFNPKVASLRDKLKRTYLKVLQDSQKANRERELARVLWRDVIYATIVRLRQEQQKYEGAALAERNDSARRDRDCLRLHFTTFLRKSEQFYRECVAAVQESHGSVGVVLPGEDAAKVTEKGAKVLTAKSGYACHSCYQSLIYLGDVLRYEQTHLRPHDKRSFKGPGSCYRQAAYLFPESGNPHNQLSVIYLLTGEDFRAVYHNYRALCSAAPFPTARENFKLLFDRIRARAAEAGEGDPRHFGAQACASHLLWACAELFSLKTFRGAEGGWDQLDAHCSAYLAHFRLLCKLSPKEQRQKLSQIRNPRREGGDASTLAFFVRTTALAICNVHECSRGCASEDPARRAWSEGALPRYLNLAVSSQVDLVRYCARVEGGAKLGLPAVNVFTGWLRHNKDALSRIERGDDRQLEGKFRAFKETLVSVLLDEHEALGGGGLDCARAPLGELLGLTEDVELRGFVPILPAQRGLTFEVWRLAQRPTEGAHRARQRLRRIAASLEEISGEPLELLTGVPTSTRVTTTRVGDFTEPQGGGLPDVSAFREGKANRVPRQDHLGLQATVLDLLCGKKAADQEYLDRHWRGVELVARSRGGGHGEESRKRKRIPGFSFPA